MIFEHSACRRDGCLKTRTSRPMGSRSTRERTTLRTGCGRGLR